MTSLFLTSLAFWWIGISPIQTHLPTPATPEHSKTQTCVQCSVKEVGPDNSTRRQHKVHHAFIIVTNTYSAGQASSRPGLPQKDVFGSRINEFEPLIKTRHPKELTAKGSESTLFAQEAPEDAQQEYRIGLKLMKQGKRELAIQSMNQALEIYPQYFQALEALGALQLSLGQANSATQTLIRATKVNPRSDRCFYYLGIAHLTLRRIEPGIKSLEQAASLNPSNAHTHLALGYALIKLGQLRQAEDHLNLSYRLGGDNDIESQLYLANLFERQGRYTEAAAALNTFINHAPPKTDKKAFRQMAEELRDKSNQKANPKATHNPASSASQH